MSAIEALLEDLGISLGPYTSTAISLAVFILTLIGVYVVGRVVIVPLVRRALNQRNVDLHARRPLLKLTWFLVILAAFGLALSVAGFGEALRSVATIAAAATLAIGFAMQNVIRNLVAGIFIFMDRPFRIGDWIEWEGNQGIVQDISLRVTRVQSFNNELLTVPNSELTENVVRNPVANDRLRLQVPFGIGYEDDIQEATEIILDEATGHPDILDEPEPSVRLVELADSSVGLQSRVWVADPTRGDVTKVRGEYVTAVKERFDEAGISIPYPQRDLSGEVVIDGVTPD